VRLVEGAVCAGVGELIDATVAGTAGRRERRRVSKHVAHCGTCRARLRGAREVHAGLAALAPLPLLVGVPAAPVPDPSPVLAWWDRLMHGATAQATSAAQTATDLSTSGVARLGAGTVAVVAAGAAGLPVVMDVAQRVDAGASEPATRPALVSRTAASPPPVTTPARPVKVAPAAPERAQAPPRRRTAAARRPAPTPDPPPVPAAEPDPPATPRAPAPIAPAPPSTSLAQEFGP
jgi:hypothetical protein